MKFNLNSKPFGGMKHRYFTVALATKDETSRGVAKACLLSVAVGTILQVVEQNHEKPR